MLAKQADVNKKSS